ncbi:B12-binding domain-containing radical SAM protein [Cellulosilyticum ruminicola]|uniref:B12-binding domain-containing radical SAM protein n=1 Tax=Cellulosilyticum ruminicola TaxID=425254 RepID=UPI0006CFD145|nr:B12-binding domain-containing radical SAM protein [Cellulosilyticum ruminicola]
MEGEGEETWNEYLDYLAGKGGTLEQINGLIYKNAEGMIVKNKPRQPLDLEYLPFVYDSLDGLEHKIIYYEASRGCPFRCQYCLSSIEHGVRFAPLERVKEHMTYFIEKRVKQVKFVDRTFNAKRQYAMEIWQHIMAIDDGYTNFHFEIAAELLTDEMIALLKDARPGLIQFEIGVQSTNQLVLDTIMRPMPFADIKEVVLKIKALGNIHQHLDLIAGLPYEDYASFGRSFNDVISLRPEQFQLGFLKLLKGSGLRQKAEEYGLIYKVEPPYEILYTKDVSYKEMLLLHDIEEMLERYYNSERFQNSLEYLFTRFESPFKCFEALAKFWIQKDYDKVQHNKMAYYYKLIEFAEEFENINSEIVKEMIRLDYLLHEHISEMPVAFETLERERFKDHHTLMLKDDSFIEKYVPNLLDKAPRHRYRLALLETFKYNVWEAHCNRDYTQIEVSEVPNCILFDYSSQTVKCTSIVS